MEIFGLLPNYTIFGDFNFLDINWDNGNSNCINGREFFNAVSSLGGFQLISQPTRGSSILDLLISSSPYLCSNIQLHDKLSSSDHLCITADLILSIPLNKHQSASFKYDFNKVNYDLLRAFLVTVDWQSIVNNVDAEIVWMQFSTLMSYILQTFVPIINFDKNNKHRVTWASQYLDKLLSIKTHLWKVFQKPLSLDAYQNYKNVSGRYKSHCAAKLDYESKLFAEMSCHPKTFYSYISKCQKHSQHNIQIVENKGLINIVKKIADKFG